MESDDPHDVQIVQIEKLSFMIIVCETQPSKGCYVLNNGSTACKHGSCTEFNISYLSLILHVIFILAHTKEI
jgi:hypothetical protein